MKCKDPNDTYYTMIRGTRDNWHGSECEIYYAEQILNKLQIIFSFLNKSYSKSDEDAKQIRKLLKKAFNEWQKNSQLEVHESNDELVNIKVLFGRLDHGDGSNFDGIGGVLGRNWFDSFIQNQVLIDGVFSSCFPT